MKCNMRCRQRSQSMCVSAFSRLFYHFYITSAARELPREYKCMYMNKTTAKHCTITSTQLKRCVTKKKKYLKLKLASNGHDKLWLYVSNFRYSKLKHGTVNSLDTHCSYNICRIFCHDPWLHISFVQFLNTYYL